MKHCSVYLRPPWLVVHSETGLYGRLWFASEPFIRLSHDVADGELAAAIARALEASHNLDDMPEGLSVAGVDKPLVALFDGGSRRKFHAGMKMVSVIVDDGGFVQIAPNRNLGPKEGFELDRDAVKRLDGADPMAIAVAVREAADEAAAWQPGSG